jgi:hypothetical protein
LQPCPLNAGSEAVTFVRHAPILLTYLRALACPCVPAYWRALTRLACVQAHPGSEDVIAHGMRALARLVGPVARGNHGRADASILRTVDAAVRAMDSHVDSVAVQVLQAPPPPLAPRRGVHACPPQCARMSAALCTHACRIVQAYPL